MTRLDENDWKSLRVQTCRVDEEWERISPQVIWRTQGVK